MRFDRSLYPFDSNYLQLNGHRLHYLDEGAGTPVVMVHGNPTWSFYYRNLVKALRDDFRCIVPDHMGCGFSDKPSDDEYNYTLESRVSDLTSLIDAVAPDGPINLIVHDWGGAIGMAWAVRNPERVSRLVILNTGAFRNPAGQKIPPSLWLVRNTPIGAFLVRGFNAFSSGATRMAVVNKMPSSIRQAYTAPYNSWKNRIATLRFVQDIPLGPKDPAFSVIEETEAGLAQLADTPALICWGAQDFVFDDGFLDEWKRQLPHATVHRYSDAGHYVLEDAGERVIASVRGFFGQEGTVGRADGE